MVGPPAGQLLDAVGDKGPAAAASLLGHRAQGRGLRLCTSSACVWPAGAAGGVTGAVILRSQSKCPELDAHTGRRTTHLLREGSTGAPAELAGRASSSFAHSHSSSSSASSSSEMRRWRGGGGSGGARGGSCRGRLAGVADGAPGGAPSSRFTPPPPLPAPPPPRALRSSACLSSARLFGLPAFCHFCPHLHSTGGRGWHCCYDLLVEAAGPAGAPAPASALAVVPQTLGLPSPPVAQVHVALGQHGPAPPPAPRGAPYAAGPAQDLCTGPSLVNRSGRHDVDRRVQRCIEQSSFGAYSAANGSRQ